jgi:hypothetical protein
VTVTSPTSLTVTAPAHAAGRVNIRVTADFGSSAIVSNDYYTFVAPPTVTQVSPSTGSIKGATVVTLTGTNFTKVTGVAFGTGAGTGLKVISATSLQVTTPSHVAGVVDVRVTTSGGLSAVTAADHYTYGPPPVVTKVSPMSGAAAGGTVVTITGTSLAGATAVTFGGTPGTHVTVVSATSLTVMSPAHAVGPVDIRVVTRFGKSAVVAADRYSYR